MLAVLAGSGRLPAALVAGCATRPVVCALEDFQPEGVTPDETFRLETLGSLIAGLKARGVTEVCFAGGMVRAPIDPARIDAATMPLVPVIQAALAAGDDGALRAVIAVFEQAGLMVRGAHEIVPALLPSEGVLSIRAPEDRDRRDAKRAQAVAEAMSVADSGQCCAVLSGQVLALEGIFGTDWMLDSLTGRPDGLRGGVFYKAPKIGQDRRVDLPTIGPDTARRVRAAGLSGLVIEAGGVIVMDQPETIAACDREELFLWVRPPEPSPSEPEASCTPS